jgi:phage internal scaffolding protein
MKHPQQKIEQESFKISQHRDYLKNPRHAHEFDEKNRGDIDFTGQVSLTRQSEAESCDINVILDRYMKTGQLNLNQRQAMFEDVSDAGTFQEALSIVKAAQEAFQTLDAKVRKEFDNDPHKFLEFCEDPNNYDRMVELGILHKEEEPVKPALPATAQKVRARAQQQEPEPQDE